MGDGGRGAVADSLQTAKQGLIPQLMPLMARVSCLIVACSLHLPSIRQSVRAPDAGRLTPVTIASPHVCQRLGDLIPGLLGPDQRTGTGISDPAVRHQIVSHDRRDAYRMRCLCSRLTVLSVRRLFHMFGFKMEDAMYSIKCSTITLLTDERKRTIFEFISPNDKYFVYPNIFFCSCPAFKRQVLTMDQTRLCKHIIATRIATALDDGSVKHGFLELKEMSRIFCDMSHCCTRRPITATVNGTRGDAADTDTSAEITLNDTSTDSLPEAADHQLHNDPLS